MVHPTDNDLALLAGGETGRIRELVLKRHLRRCERCQTAVHEFEALRNEMSAVQMPDIPVDLNWNGLAAEMRANIRLGLEAGACVRATRQKSAWVPRLGYAFAGLVLLIASGEVVHRERVHGGRPPMQATLATPSTAASLEMTNSGVELRSGSNSMLLLNHHGDAANQTVSAQGDIGARYIDGETGAVTINNVYLQ